MTLEYTRRTMDISGNKTLEVSRSLLSISPSDRVGH